jgi:PIN domain nuclease of toxin-antitoxin system
VSDTDPATGYLLDTHIALFSLRESSALTKTAKATVAQGPNFLSVVSYWEVMVKCMKGSLVLGDPRAWWTEALERLAAMPIVLRAEHISAVADLPLIHKDPFDRMLIAQASVEGLTLVSMDATVAQYASKTVRVIG